MNEILKDKKAKTLEEIFEYISNQYPSIDSQEQILATLLYMIKVQNTFTFILRIICDKDEVTDR